MTAAQRRSSATIRLAMISLSAMDSAMVRFTLLLVVGLRRADENRHLGEGLRAPRSALSSPLLLGTSTISETSSGTSIPRSTSTPSDSWGMTSGRTKLATSMRFRPVRAELVDQVESCRRWRWFRVRSEIRRAARLRGYRRASAMSQAGPFLVELVAKLRGGDRGHAFGPFADAASAQVRDAVFGDDGVDVGARRW